MAVVVVLELFDLFSNRLFLCTDNFSKSPLLLSSFSQAEREYIKAKHFLPSLSSLLQNMCWEFSQPGKLDFVMLYQHEEKSIYCHRRGSKLYTMCHTI